MKPLIMWVLVGAGVVLVYAAYKNKSPQTILSNTLDAAQGK